MNRPAVLLAALALPAILAAQAAKPAPPKVDPKDEPTLKEAPICPNASKANATDEDKECRTLLKGQLLWTQRDAIVSQAQAQINSQLAPITAEISKLLEPICTRAGIPVDRCQPDFRRGVVVEVPAPAAPTAGNGGK